MSQVYIASTYNRTCYHLDDDCRRLVAANDPEAVDVTRGILTRLVPCKVCMGTNRTGERDHRSTLASELRNTDPEDVGV